MSRSPLPYVNLSCIPCFQALSLSQRKNVVAIFISVLVVNFHIVSSIVSGTCLFQFILYIVTKVVFLKYRSVCFSDWLQEESVLLTCCLFSFPMPSSFHLQFNFLNHCAYYFFYTTKSQGASDVA